MAAKGKIRGSSLGFNMTPMIDIVFLLIIFFVLVSNYSSAERVPVELPNPYKSQARKVKVTDRVIVNCQWSASGPDGQPGVVYRAGPNPPEPLERISDRLAAARAAAAAEGRELIAVIRADRRLPFEDVRAVMRMITENQIEQMRLVAQAGEEP